MIKHPRFNTSFQNLYQLHCHFFENHEILDRLANLCKNIQVLVIDFNGSQLHNYKIQNKLGQLIKAQNRIKDLVFFSEDNIILSRDIKEAIMVHSKSIINYESYGENDSNFLLMSNFQNLKSLTLSFTNNNFKYLKSISFSKIEVANLTI